MFVDVFGQGPHPSQNASLAIKDSEIAEAAGVLID
jgi:hypothetical protein